MSSTPSLKVAVIHDWLTVNGGAEVVLKHILSLVPEADIYTMVDTLEENEKEWLKGHVIYTSPLQKFLFIAKRYKYFIPMMPYLIEQFDLSKYDLIISSSHAVAKGVLTHPHQRHIAYIYSPLRYAWDMSFTYDKMGVFKRGLTQLVMKRWLHKMRIWDQISASRPDTLIAVSQFISKRIEKSWRRENRVLYPPVELKDTRYCERKKEYYVTLSRLVEYKRIDIIVDAFNHMPDKELIIIGTGSQLKKLKSKSSKNISFTGYLDREEAMQYLAQARGFIFMSKEDFGIVPVEAQACGTPVIAYQGGGASETVIDGLTGLLVNEQTSEALILAVKNFEELTFDSKQCRDNAKQFSVENFKTEFKKLIEE